MTARRLAPGFGLSLLLCMPAAGCYRDVDSFAIKAAKLSCKRVRECRKDVFDEQYRGDMGYCKDEITDDFLDIAEAADDLNCDYVPDQGRECIDVLQANRKVCDDRADADIADACALLDVFDCPVILDRGEPEVIGSLASWPLGEP